MTRGKTRNDRRSLEWRAHPIGAAFARVARYARDTPLRRNEHRVSGTDVAPRCRVVNLRVSSLRTRTASARARRARARLRNAEPRMTPPPSPSSNPTSRPDAPPRVRARSREDEQQVPPPPAATTTSAGQAAARPPSLLRRAVRQHPNASLAAVTCARRTLRTLARRPGRRTIIRARRSSRRRTSRLRRERTRLPIVRAFRSISATVVCGSGPGTPARSGSAYR